MVGERKMSEENNGYVEDITFPPQSSLKLVSHGNVNKPETFYYTWEIKKYCDNLDEAFNLIVEMNKKMKEQFTVQ